MSINPSIALEAALAAREALIDPRLESALRLFNGFLEGHPSLVVDLYGRTVVLHDSSEAGDEAGVRAALAIVVKRIPGIACALWKQRKSSRSEDRNGRFVLGDASALTTRIRENGVHYSLALTMNRDASFYVDTRNLRAFAKAELGGKRVLNTFAQAGSLGVAARAGGAEVVHTDLNRRFLNVAKDSYSLNGWPIRRSDFRTGDFFDVLGQLKRDGALFDAIFLDPPFFSVTEKGRVDTELSVERLVNKVRPLLADEGQLVFVNNALFLSGSEFVASLEALGANGYLAVEGFVPVPEDTTGFAATRVGAPPVDPAPFNHSTKIVRLRARRKDGRRA